MLRIYADDSPEAMARVLAMVMVCDARLDPRETDAIEELGIGRVLGLDQARFLDVVHGYCDDLLRLGRGDGEGIRLLDPALMDAVLDGVSDGDRRLDVCSAALNLIESDGELHPAELAVFQHMLKRWGHTLESLHAALSRRGSGGTELLG